MPARRKSEYLEGLRDGREVYFKGERIDDVTTHPATEGMIQTQGELFDLQYDDEHGDLLTYESPSSGDPVSVFYRKPRSPADLEERRQASKLWMDYTCGMSGRANDFLASGLTGLAIGHEHFDTDERDYGDHILEYYEHVRENDLSLTHALIDPQIDRSKGGSFRLEDEVERPGSVRVVDEDDSGIYVSGARMLATLGPQADEIMVYPFGYYGEDGPEVVAFAVPVGADGVRQICRPQLSRNDVRNHPLSSRFDEMDTFVVFDHVHVPWERVFVYGDADVANGWRAREKTAYANLAYHQTAVKDLAKAEFAWGVAMLLAESTGIDDYFHVQSKLGEIGVMVEQTRACITAAEADGYYFDDEFYVPEPSYLFAVSGSFPDMYPRIIEILRDLGGSGLIGVPAWEDLEADGPLGSDVKAYFRGADMDAVERLGVQKLAYEMAIGGMGSREELYERFYTGGPMRVKSNFWKNHGRTEEFKEKAVEYGLRGVETEADPTAARGAVADEDD